LQDLGERVWLLKLEGHSTQSALERLGVERSQALFVSDRWRAQVEEERYLHLDSLFSDALQVLDDLLARRLRLALLTGRTRREAATRQLGRLGLAARFDIIHIVEPGRVVEEKTVLLRRLRPLVYVGDSELDHASAQDARVPFVGVSTGQRSMAYLASQGISPVFHSLTAARGALGLAEIRTTTR
jgi:phosphoglycolate phosphatase-like HAD superfamily hydrolase